MIHIATEDDNHGLIPLCGRADWSGLTHAQRSECWECNSIAGFDEDAPCPCGRSHTIAEHDYDPDKEEP